MEIGFWEALHNGRATGQRINTLCDAGGFYTASEDVLKHYMDPRNMSLKVYFQFESQAYDSSQTKDVVQGILNGTFMAGNYSYTDGGRTVTKNYADTLWRRKKPGVSPYFLAARPSGAGRQRKRAHPQEITEPIRATIIITISVQIPALTRLPMA